MDAFITHENLDRCVVTAYEKYFRVDPFQIVQRRSTCALYSFQETHDGKRAVWCSRQAIGRQKLVGVVQGTCQKAGFDGKRTNEYLV